MYSFCRIAAALLIPVCIQLAPAQTASDLFDDSQLHDIRLEIHPTDWESLKVNFEENTYYAANLQWRGLAVENVGVRSRGFGSRNGIKPNIRVDFNRYEANQSFLGLKSVVLDSSVQDPTQMREHLSMLVLRELGIPAPRSSNGRLFINGRYSGLYVIMETIDKNFLQRAFGEDGGYLYEFNWVEPFYFDYRGDDPELYSPAIFEPKTRESEPAPGPIVDLIRFVNQASDEEFAAGISGFLDANRLVQFLALENFIAEYDGIAGYAGMNNFYLYRDNAGVSTFIPWDKDNAFNDTYFGISRNLDQNVLTRRILAIPEYRQVYLDTLTRAAELAGGPGGWLRQQVDRLYTQIRSAVYEDPVKLCPATDYLEPCSNERFEAEAEFLRNFADERSWFVSDEVAKLQSEQ